MENSRAPRRGINLSVFLMIAAAVLAIAVVVFFIIREEVQRTVRARNVQRYGELIDAVKAGDIAAVTDLLEQGVPMKQEPFASILTIAATSAKLPMVRALVNLGADVTLRDPGGNTPLAYADRNGRIDVANFLAQALAEASPPGGPIQKLWADGIPFTARAFIAAADENDIERVRLFLDAGMHVDTESAKGRTALTTAAWQGNPDMTRLLLDRGIAMHSAQSALEMAAGRGHHAVVAALIEAGVDPDGPEESWSALLRALSNPQMRQFLVENGADLDHPQDDRGHTALQIAVSSRLVSPSSNYRLTERRDWVRFLIDNGADVNAADMRGLRTLDLARIEGDDQIIRWLEEAGAVGTAQ